MAEVSVISQFVCPSCAALLEPSSEDAVACGRCGWKGEVFFFTPRVLEAEPAEMALPDDAACLHHPRKKAVAVCAGTGDYICSLCSVELNGRTYGAEYLNSGGKEVVGKAFERTLPRPDSRVMFYVASIFIPYVNFLSIPLAVFWLPHAFILYFRALQQRRENPLFRRLMGMGRVIILPILLSLISVGWVAGVAALVIALMNRRT